MNVLADTAVVYLLVSTSMIAYNNSRSSEERSYSCVPSREDAPSRENDEYIG